MSKFMSWLKGVFSKPSKPKAESSLPSKKLESFEHGSAEWYLSLWTSVKFDEGFEPGIESVCKQILSHKIRYLAVSVSTNVPWYVVAGIHFMEASLNFSSVLHNGEKIIGKNVKTKLVPAGRGPFNTWEDAAIDALVYDNLIGIRDWSIGLALKRCEAYNGLGYLKYHKTELTPYLWAQTNHNDGTGLYVADGKWSELKAANARPGIAAILKKLQQMGESITI